MLVSLRPSLEPSKVETICLVMVVELSPYKMLVLPHCVLQSSQSEESAVKNTDTMGSSFQWATNMKPVFETMNKNLTSVLSPDSGVAAAYKYRDKLVFFKFRFKTFEYD